MKNNKKLIGFLLSTISAVVNADLGSVHSEASGDPGLRTFIEDNNLPQPGSGIQIVPFAQTSFAKEKNSREIFEAERKLDYIKKRSDAAIFLLKIKNDKYYPGTKKIFETNTDPYDSHLKASLSQIKLAFSFNGISFIEKANIIGYAVAGSWKNGWTGVVERFNDKTIGICDYFRHNAILSHSAVRLVKENVIYDVNQKPTMVSVEGQEPDGFSYKVDWYDNEFYHTLTCANTYFSKKIKMDAIALAKRIDSDMQ